jgi:hypothetical protein
MKMSMLDLERVLPRSQADLDGVPIGSRQGPNGSWVSRNG